MKYGIIVNGRVTEPVSIPDTLSSWAQSPEAFLARMFPGRSGWVIVSEDAVPGTLSNSDGIFTNPPPAETTTPEKTSLEKILERLDAIEAKIDGSTP